MNITIISDPEFEISTTGITFSKGLDFEKWKELGAELTAKGRSVNFHIGDWINHGQKAYGSKYEEALKRTGMDYGHLRNIASVARKIPLAVRRADLGFEQHKVVAKFKDPIEQARWLAFAKESKLSVPRLRKSINLKRLASEKETKRNASVRSIDNYTVSIGSLNRSLKSEILRDPIKNWDENRRRTVRRDLEPIVKIYNELLPS